MIAFGYVRVSTDEQATQGHSLFEQEERLQAYFKSIGAKEVHIYTDDGYSAKDLRRPELQRMLEDVKTKKPFLVATTKLNRLSRKLLDILSVIEFLDRYDCNYTSVTEPFETQTPAGRLQLQVLGMVAEFERERISEDVRNNMMSLVRNGTKVITRPCYGYDVVDGIMQINVEEALIVQKMAKWTLEGLGGRRIAQKLNQLGVKTKSGKQWHDKVIRDLLRRETLIGEIVYNRTYKKGTRILTRPESEWIRIPDHHEPILDEDTFYAVQRVLDSRRTANRHSSEDRYLLSGLITCGHCGSKMNGKRQVGRKRQAYYRYVCDGYAKKGTCFYHMVRRDDLEKLVIDRIKEISNTSKTKLKIKLAEPSKTKNDEKRTIEARLSRLDKKMQKQIEAFEEDLISARDLKKARERLDNERITLLNALEELEKDKTDENKKVQESAKRLLSDVLSVDRLKAKTAIRQLIHNIEITNGDTVALTWYPD